jgi:LuxR family transcriptional regulator, regulator of acetate metabolism
MQMIGEGSQQSALADVRQALSRLHTPSTLPELYDRATRALCDHTEFDRAVLFRLEGFEMIPHSVWFTGDPEWAEEFRRIGHTSPMRIDYDIVETEMISTRAPMFVPNAQSNPRGFKPLVEGSRTRSYAAAPLVPENVLIGFIHADCYFADRDVNEDDRDLLGVFAEGLGYAIQRTALLTRVERQRTQINRLRSVIDETLTKVSDAVAALEVDADDGPTTTVLSVPGFEITRREAEILRLIDTGASEDQAADELGIPRPSVRWHLGQLRQKLGADSTASAVARWRALAP